MAARASVQAARSSGDVKAVGVAEGPLRASVGAIVATAEAYPELRASQNFQQLLSRITGLENAISDRREFYNETANLNNVRIEQFPDVIAARLFGFRPAALLEFDAAEIADVDVRGLFRS
jgi:LemA protein